MLGIVKETFPALVAFLWRPWLFKVHDSDSDDHRLVCGSLVYMTLVKGWLVSVRRTSDHRFDVNGPSATGRSVGG